MAAIGLTLLLASRRGVERGVIHVGLTTAIALAVADVWFVLHRRIGPVYLADGIIELGLAAAWVFVLLPLRR